VVSTTPEDTQKARLVRAFCFLRFPTQTDVSRPGSVYRSTHTCAAMRPPARRLHATLRYASRTAQPASSAIG
jgi:hypothetical protein